jgi:hypothetical protein
MPGPRIILVEIYKVPDRARIYAEEFLRFRSFSSPPALLRACKTSRAECLKVFTACLTTWYYPRRIYFDGKQDTLILLATTKLLHLAPSSTGFEVPLHHGINLDCFSNITKLAIPDKQLDWFGH